MDNHQIEQIYYNLGEPVCSKFAGCFLADRLPQKFELDQFYVLNTIPSSQSEPGHWVVYFGSERGGLSGATKDSTTDNQGALYFDSFGNIPDNPDLIRKSLDIQDRIFYNNFSLQSIFSNSCAIHCLLVSFLWAQGLCMSEILTRVYNTRTRNELENDVIAYQSFKKIYDRRTLDADHRR